MKILIKIPVVAFFLMLNFSLTAQTMSGYFEYRGVGEISKMAHITNDYVSGEFNMDNQNVYVLINSKDNTFGASITTVLTIEKGLGGLYFSNIIVDKDNDFPPPFEAFGLSNQLVIELIKSIDKEMVSKIRDEIVNSYGTDVEQWSGRMWALFALNLDYYSYMLGR